MGATGSYAAEATARDLRTETVSKQARSAHLWITGLAASASWLIAAGLTVGWRDATPWERTSLLGTIEATVGVLLAITALVPSLASRIRHIGPWLVALPLLVTIWEAITAKLSLLPLP